MSAPLTIEPEPEPDYSEAWFAELGSYLCRMQQVQMRTFQLDLVFDNLLGDAARDIRLYFDARWHDAYQRAVDAMHISATLIDEAKPSEPLGEVYLLFKYEQIVYLCRTTHAAKALACFQQGDIAGAVQALEKFKEETINLERLFQDRAQILNPSDRFNSLREYIKQKKLERAQVAAQRIAAEQA